MVWILHRTKYWFGSDVRGAYASEPCFFWSFGAFVIVRGEIWVMRSRRDVKEGVGGYKLNSIIQFRRRIEEATTDWLTYVICILRRLHVRWRCGRGGQPDWSKRQIWRNCTAGNGCSVSCSARLYYSACITFALSVGWNGSASKAIKLRNAKI